MRSPVGEAMIVLITGPVRAGKSARAMHVARALGRPVTYIATARVDPGDAEMLERVARHRVERGEMPAIELWTEGTADLPAIVGAASAHTTLLIDSLGTWIAGHLFDLEQNVERNMLGARALLEARTDPLIEQVRSAKSNLILVSEEAGWGLVPASPQGRIFRDVLGRLAQRIARQADRVELVVAGFAVDLRAHGVPIESFV